MAQALSLLFVALYTDEDVSPNLAPALRRRGYVAQSAIEAGNTEVSDEAQLAYATEKGMALLTYNIHHFIPLAQTWYLAGGSMPVSSSPSSSVSVNSANSFSAYSGC